MFENCNTLRDLNAARVKAVSVDKMDVTEVNNAYNARRQQILESATHADFKIITFHPLVFEAGPKYSSLPIVGTATKLGCIELNAEGFLL